MNRLVVLAALVAPAALAGCGSGSEDLHGDGSCDRYLACILVTAPEAYAAALASYGDDSPCWADDDSTAQCSTACAASLDNIGDACRCDGPSCEAVDTVFTLAAGDYTLVESGLHPDAGSRDDCAMLDDVRATRWILRGPVDEANPAMFLDAPDVGFGVDLAGRIKNMQGELIWGEGDGFWGVNVIVTADDAFAMAVGIEIVNSSFSCRSDLLVRLRRS